MKNKVYSLVVGPTLDQTLRELEESSGLNKGEIMRQALALYNEAYKATKVGGRILIETPSEQEGYSLLEVKIGK